MSDLTNESLDKLMKLASEGSTSAIVELRDRQATGKVGRVWDKPRAGALDDGVTAIVVNAARGLVNIKTGRAGELRVDEERLGWWLRTLCGAMSVAVKSAMDEGISIEEVNHLKGEEDFKVEVVVSEDQWNLRLRPADQNAWSISVSQVLEFMEVILDVVWDNDLQMSDLGFSHEETAMIEFLTLLGNRDD